MVRSLSVTKYLYMYIFVPRRFVEGDYGDVYRPSVRASVPNGRPGDNFGTKLSVVCMCILSLGVMVSIDCVRSLDWLWRILLCKTYSIKRYEQRLTDSNTV